MNKWSEIENLTGIKRKNCQTYLRKWNIPQRGKFGSLSSAWQGGITKIHERIRKTNLYIEWRNAVFIRDGYKSVLSQKSGYLHAHHLIPFTKILKIVLTKNKPLKNTLFYEQAVINDPRFYAVDNGVTLLREEHHQLESATNVNTFPN